VDAGPDVLEETVGLGPISPELALVDPVLAEQARKLLPDPVEAPRRSVPVVRPASPSVVPEPIPAPEPVARAPEPAAEPVPAAPARRRRWRLAVALAVIVYVAGAVSGTFLGGHTNRSPGVTFEARTDAEPATTGAQPARTAAQQTQRAVPRAKRAPKKRRSPRRAPTTWAANVIGVETSVGPHGVTLAWTPPADSRHVVVLRARGVDGRAVVVFRGGAANYRDGSARPCSSYRYTIVNYDRHGHRSTGVPTSVVTGGCT